MTATNKATPEERAREKRAQELRNSLRGWRALETALHQELRDRLDPDEPLPKDETLSYNACGDPYGCGCGSITLNELTGYIDRLKAELATLPHIPNKAERKRLRQERAMSGHANRSTRDRSGRR